MTIPLFHVDAFADVPFTGNPAAVCLLPAWPDDRWLAGVAAEMNLSETAFLVRRTDGEYDLRWLTPAVEVDLCGHATLASAHVLWRHGFSADDRLRFRTRSGVLTATRHGEEIELDFPLTAAEPTDAPPGLLEALGATATYVGRSRFDFLVEVASEDVVRGLTPDFKLLAGASARGVIVTSRSGGGRFDFVSRFFAPAAGVDEDPVTGSAHCCLADHWHKRLGKTDFTAYQASKRGGVVKVRVDGNRARLAGRAVTVARGELTIGGAT